jgi:DNA-binding helix-hairpin-helix protein with protein kinase domain
VPVFDRGGQPVRLSQPVGSGGEGVVYAVDGAPDVVAKLYHAPAAPAQAAKLVAMTALDSERLRRVAAWPLGTLHDSPGGAVRGLLMPRLTLRKPIHQLYGPRSRLAEFPRADWRFLVRAAGNLARAFAVVHAHGQVVGDVNQGNVLVAQDATVGLIDCDSFQIEKDGQRFPCEVAVSTFQPPELQGLPTFRGVARTRDHDNFGLAVLLFHLLMLGRHPFAGAYGGGEEMPVERAIRELRFAYGRRAGERGMRPPPLAPTLDAVSEPVAELFERAFAPEAARRGRPTAESWAGALEALWHEVVACPDNPGHRQHFRLASCPWCAIERQAGTVLFPVVTSPPSGPAFDLAAAWAAIEAVRGPGPAPALPQPAPPPRPRRSVPSGRAAAEERRRGGLTAGLALAGMAGCALAGPLPQPGTPGLASLALGASLAGWVWSEPWRRGRALAAARRRARDEWARAVARWTYGAGDETFQRKRRRLDETKAEYHDLPASHRRRLQALESGRQERQRQRFLERHDLASAGLKGVGPGREAMLASYGITTAADVTSEALARMPGFGASLTRQLLDWRRRLERGFVFDPAQGIDRAELLAVEAAVQADRRRLEQTLRHGAADLRALADAAERARKALRPTVERAFAALALAEAAPTAGPTTSRDRPHRPEPAAAPGTV